MTITAMAVSAYCSLASFIYLALSSLVSSNSADGLPSAWTNGLASFYGGAPDGMSPYSPSFGTMDGSCGYGLLNQDTYPYWSVAAISTSNSFFLLGPTEGCGMCFQIQCMDESALYQGRCNVDPNARSIMIMITDSCPQCEPDQFDIQALTFNKMAPMSSGRVATQYRRVDCTPPSGIQISVDQNSGAGNWLRLTVQSTGGLGAVELVQVGGLETGWQSMTNVFGSAWQITQSPAAPLDLKVVDASGAEVTAIGIIDSNGQTGIIPTGVNFNFSTTPGASIQPLSSNVPVTSSQSSATVSAFAGPPSYSQGKLSAGNPTQPPASWQLAPPSPSAVTGTSAVGGSCSDTTPPGSQYSCPQQKALGQCSASWMTQSSPSNPAGYCMSSCGRCAWG